MIARKGSARVIVVGKSVVLYTEGDEARFHVSRSHLSDLIDCLIAIDGRKGSPSWVAAQLGIEIDGERVSLGQFDARPPATFDGLFKRCPRGEACIHKKLCPGSIR